MLPTIAEETPGKEFTALHWAVNNKHSLCVSTLLTHGAQVDQRATDMRWEMKH